MIVYKKFSILFILFYIFISFFPIDVFSFSKTNNIHINEKLYFLENKGQIKDQNGYIRTDIQYAIQAEGILIFIGNSEVHYQFYKKENCSYEMSINNINPIKKESNSLTSNFDAYRMDVELLNANKCVEIITSEEQPYFENYYLPGFQTNGITSHSFNKITYKNVYPDIDWVLCINNNKLEQEFIAGANADVSQIKIKYNGQTSLQTNKDGSITATTPLGSITEHAPICYNTNGMMLDSKYAIEDNIITYKINAANSLVIDPIVEWATYYGPTGTTTSFYAVTSDDTAKIYACGLTYAATAFTIATTGSYQSTIGGDADAFLMKFDSSGNRLWATYFGGSRGDWASALSCDHNGFIYLGGSTNSIDSISTVGSAEPSFVGGMWSGFLAKFNSSGNRIWATYVGGSVGATFDLEIASLSCDLFNHVYVSGATDDTDNVATPGSFKPRKVEGMDTTVDCYLIQYDSSGRKNWGTYYGGHGRHQDFQGVNCNDGLYVFLGGWTNDTDSIASLGCYQCTLRGASDAFLVKFDSSGHRLWSTYYGGEGSENIGGISCDADGNLYLLGGTNSDSGIVSAGCYQPLRGSGTADDAFLVKFDDITGFRLWGTYFGGPANEDVQYSRIINRGAAIYITGYTSSTSGIASTGAWQTTYGGGTTDAFLASYNAAGIQQWSTYYGGTSEDRGIAVAFDGKGIYMVGDTKSTTQIATPGSFESSGGGSSFSNQGFLVKFVDTLSTLSSSELFYTDNVNTVYPNPTKGEFTVTGKYKSAFGNVVITVTDLIGREILNEKALITNNRFSKNIKLTDGLSTGVYLVKIIANETSNVLILNKN